MVLFPPHAWIFTVALGCVVVVDAFDELFCASTRGFIDNVAAATVANIVANSIIDNGLGLLIGTLVDEFVFIRSVTLVIHSSNVSKSRLELKRLLIPSLKGKCTRERTRKYYIYHEVNSYSIIDKLLSQMW